MTRDLAERTKQAITEGRTADATRQTEAVLAVADHLRGSPQLVNDLIAWTFEVGALGALPAGTVIGAGGQTAGERLTELRQDQLLHDFVQLDDFIRRESTASEFEIFAQLRAERGALAAFLWVSQLRKLKQSR